MGRKGVSKRKPKTQKQKVKDAANTGSTSSFVESSRESDAQTARVVARGQAITSGKGGKEKYSESTNNKKK